MNYVENKADLCPVCKGSGKYTEYVNYGTTTGSYIEKTCHGCNGKGWVVVSTINTSITRG